MTYMAVALDHRIAVGKTMHHTRILQVCPLLQNDPPKIAPQAGQRADVTMGADNHITNQHR
ncbi:hypothetical protein PPC_3158 [Pseudomonas protegens Cab57]|nr:hypothetical protein PPC_3158 [Pseudomonas protegens Cab57]